MLVRKPLEKIPKTAPAPPGLFLVNSNCGTAASPNLIRLINLPFLLSHAAQLRYSAWQIVHMTDAVSVLFEVAFGNLRSLSRAVSARLQPRHRT